MDWYLDATDPEAVRNLRHEIGDYLRRHAADDADTDAAELAVAELLGNVVRHAPGPAWVSLSWATELPTLVVHDLGPGFDLAGVLPADPLAESGRGLFIVSSLTPELTAAARAHGGARVSAVLPVQRRRETSHDPRPSAGPSLPGLDEAHPAGGFGRESFLRALVVQLAQAVERLGGPDVAEEAVALVGRDVGGQMEREYRAAKEIVGRLRPDQLADCLVRLKHAIEGDFYVIEANEHRIVLGNHRCPFGDVVQRAPALCRMTSSVFGGIAAANSEDGAAIVLEERIAVGDPGCRVVVHLGPAPEESAPFAHRYGARRAG